MVVTELLQPMAIAGILVCLLAATLLKQHHLSLGRLRSLLPSWRFFDDTGDEFSLWVRVGPSRQTCERWHPALAPVQRGRHWWLVSPETNLRLADYRWLQLVAENLESQANHILESHAYGALRQLAATTANTLREAGDLGYQFELRVHHPETNPGKEDVMLISEFVPFEGEHA